MADKAIQRRNLGMRGFALVSLGLAVAAGMAWVFFCRSPSARKHKEFETKTGMPALACACSSRESCERRAALHFELASQALSRGRVDPASLQKAKSLAVVSEACLEGLAVTELTQGVRALNATIARILEREQGKARLLWDLAGRENDPNKKSKAGARLLDLLGPENEDERRYVENALKRVKGKP